MAPRVGLELDRKFMIIKEELGAPGGLPPNDIDEIVGCGETP